MIKLSQEKKRVWPSGDEARYTLRLLSERERLVLIIFLALWGISFLGLLTEVNRRFAVAVPAVGGVWREGIVGSPHFINPLLAISDPDRDLSSLVYAGLMRPDGLGGLKPELASSYEISQDGLSYTFHLRPEAEFHDGEKLTAEDILFTVELAKNPALKSPLRASWEGVLAEKMDEQTVRFILRRPYAPFLENATLGILPKHLWKDFEPEQMSLAELNIKPVGAGPYKIAAVGQETNGIITSYTLSPFRKYALNSPYLKKMVFRFYPSEVELLNAYEFGAIDAMSALSPQNIKKIVRKDGLLKSLNLPRIFGVFFNQNEKSLFAEGAVREALASATDKERIQREVLLGYGQVISSPIPQGTFGALAASGTPHNLEKAQEILGKAGWRKNPESGLYEKIEKKKVTNQLIFTLATSNAPDLVRTADILRSNWEALGAKVEVRVFEIADLNQNIIRPRKYETLLFGEVVGRDPDPFAFWHSSQRNDPGLNIALYTNRKADRALEEARASSDHEVRRQKYEEFQKEVMRDLPAVFLYSPFFLYLVPENLKGFETEHITIPAERFSNIASWYFQTTYVWKIFQTNQ